MKQWQQAWHNIAKRLPIAGLEALAEAVAHDDSKLVPDRFVTSDGCGCAIGYTILTGDCPEWTDAEIVADDLFFSLCQSSPVGVPHPTAFTAKFDEALREGGEVRAAFLAEFRPEVDRAIIDHKAKGLVRLSDEWWASPNPAFQFATPMDEVRRHGRGALERMLIQIESGVAN